MNTLYMQELNGRKKVCKEGFVGWMKDRKMRRQEEARQVKGREDEGKERKTGKK